MKQKSMTALVSAFSRAYHALNNNTKVFNDSVASIILSQEEYSEISKNMSKGIGFFNPEFIGSEREALRWIVDNQLSPSPIGRTAYAEKSLERAVRIGAKQYLIFGAGYDTFAYRQPDFGKKIEIFEIDLLEMSMDKKERLNKANIFIPKNVHYIEADFTKETWELSLINNDIYDRDKISFCSLLGLSYYLTEDSLKKMISVIQKIVPKGSTLVFDYPDQSFYTNEAGERAKKQSILAAGANENMLASYSYSHMEKLLEECGFLIYEHLTPKEMTEQYFEEYNKANKKHKITAFDNVNYCLAVKP